jgi:CubicO group peptidase (beta-lactamase class C family)
LPEATAELTVDSLLAHSSGLPAVPELWKHVQPSGGEYASGGGFPDPDQIERAQNALYQIEPVAEPGRRIIYSCTGYLLLGEVVKALSGEPLARRFTHFSGSSTASFRATVNGDTSFALGFLPPPRERERSAPTEADRWRGRRIQGEVHDENAYALGGAAGNAGLFGTLRAVHTHILRLWGPLVGAGEEEALLPERDARKMATVRESLPLPAHLLTGLPGSVERRGLGVRLAPKEWQETTGMSEESFGHTGFTGTSFWIDPPRQLVIVALTNRLYYGREASEAGLGDYRRLLHRRVLESFR